MNTFMLLALIVMLAWSTAEDRRRRKAFERYIQELRERFPRADKY